ncbi:MAG: hypothetical protein HGA45_25160, partial [Chloroflexales bacterium]|nr:hypothetical protein [Chloroflexales bacterium]
MHDPLAADALMSHIRALADEIGPRPPGHAEEARAREYIRAALAALGYDQVEELPFQTIDEPIYAFFYPLCLSAAGALSDLCPTPDGSAVYALWSTVGAPPRIVRFDARTEDQVPEVLPNGIDERGIDAPGVVDRLTARAADGTEIGSWLV